MNGFLIFFALVLSQVQAHAGELKTFAVRVDPVSLMYGIPGAGIDFGVTSRVTVGGFFQSLSSDTRNRSFSVKEISLVSMIYVSRDRFQDGWVIQPAIRYYDSSDVNTQTRRDLNQRGVYLTATGGYEWDWQSGFNVALGAGLSYGIDSVSKRELDPLLNCQMGWIF